jgi:protein-disulfide isomerase
MIRVALALLALMTPIAASAAAPRHLPTHNVRRGPVDWTQTVALTPDGGIRMGNPAARLKLVEFSSFTCPHCAAFAGEGFTPLAQKYVRGGQVSFELRSAVRDAIDLTVARAVRCVALPRYFGAVEAVMGSQQDWLTKMYDYVNAHRDDLNGANKTAAVHGMLADAGVAATLAKQGVTPAALDRCLESKPIEDALQKTSNDAWNVRHISGTPGFMINDVIQSDVFGWAQLEPAIQAALKG